MMFNRDRMTTLLAPERMLRKQFDSVAPEVPWGKEVIQIDPEIGEVDLRFYPGGCFLLTTRYEPKLGAGGNGLTMYVEGSLSIAGRPCSVKRPVKVPQLQTKVIGVVKEVNPGPRTEPGTVLWLSGEARTQDCLMVVRAADKQWVDGYVYQPTYMRPDSPTEPVAGVYNLHYVRVSFHEAWLVDKAHWILSNAGF